MDPKIRYEKALGRMKKCIELGSPEILIQNEALILFSSASMILGPRKMQPYEMNELLKNIVCFTEEELREIDRQAQADIERYGQGSSE